MNPAQHYADAKGLDLSAFVQAANLLHVDGSWSITRWDEAVLGPRPTEDDLSAVAALPDPDPLPALKVALSQQIDAAAEALRLTLITPGSGQAMEYQEAYAEAVQVDAAIKANAAVTFDPAAFPMLSASLGYDRDPSTGEPTTDIASEARAVLAAYDAYQRAGAAIRGARLKAKAEIAAATSEVAAVAIFSGLIWPKLG